MSNEAPSRRSGSLRKKTSRCVFLLALVTVLLAAVGCSGYVVNYTSRMQVDVPITYKVKLDVRVPQEKVGPFLADSVAGAITRDLKQNVFLNLVEAQPDALAIVEVSELYRRYEHWYMSLLMPFSMLGIPYYREVCGAKVNLRLLRSDSSVLRAYDGSCRKSMWVGAYYGGDWPGIEEALRGSMESIKRQMVSDCGEIAAAMQAGRTSARAQVQPAVSQSDRPPILGSVLAFDDAGRDGTLDGGEKVGLTVRATNSGEGSAKGVVVKLSGTSKALQYLGVQQVVGDIPAGQTREAKFETVLPNRIEPDNGNIVIRVTEANGFDALEEKELIVAMQPAKVTRETQVVSTLVDVDAPLAPSGFKRDDAYAVVVGISGYRQSSLPKVAWARKDAEAMKDYLVGVCGFKTENVKLLTDDGATLSDLFACYEEWLARNVRKGSFVFVYFAGHGTPSPDKGEAYLVPYDGEPGFVSKLYPLSRLYSSLAALPTDQVVVALDACFSGAGGRSVMEQGKRPLVAVDLEKGAEKLGNVAVLTASAGNEISQDFDAKRHGLFTYYLLKGLRGEADADKDGWVTVKELHSYVSPKVADESCRLGYTQSPQLLPQPAGARANVRLAKVR